jgi:hypothetical protein
MLRVTVEDDGIGFAASMPARREAGSVGVSSMRWRSASARTRDDRYDASRRPRDRRIPALIDQRRPRATQRRRSKAPIVTPMQAAARTAVSGLRDKRAADILETLRAGTARPPHEILARVQDGGEGPLGGVG